VGCTQSQVGCTYLEDCPCSEAVAWRAARDGAAEAPGRPADAPVGVRTGAGTIDQGKARHNAGKPPLHLVALDGLALVAWVSAFGAAKYSERGWERAAADGVFSWSDCVRALLSHTAKLMAGQRLDSESGLPHVGHIAWNALALCTMLVRRHGKDDLPGGGGDYTYTEAGEWVPGPAFHEAVDMLHAKRNTVA
jgi:hypothetical protein